MWISEVSGTTFLSDSRPGTSDLLRSDLIARLFREATPSYWGFDFRANDARNGPDAILWMRPSEDVHVPIVVEAKTAVEPRDIPRIAEQLSSYSQQGPYMLVAPYLSPRTQRLLAERGINFADLTGNMLFSLEEPLVYIYTRGASADPWRESRPVRSLKGPAAGRVVRALCDFRPPYRLRELSVRASIPIASVSRIVQLLDREALVLRGNAGEIVDVHWKELIHRWVEDYDFQTSNRVFAYLDPRGPQNLIDRLERVEAGYAITGSFAASQVAPYAPPRLATVYVDDAEALAREAQLRPTSSGMNALLARPFDPVVFDRTWAADGRTYAALSQVAADLLTSPGRAPAEAEELLRWMGEHEADWRV